MSFVDQEVVVALRVRKRRSVDGDGHGALLQMFRRMYNCIGLQKVYGKRLQ